MALAKNLYNSLPAPAQTLALNLYGFRNRLRLAWWERYLASIAHTERMPQHEQERLVARRLRAILTHAVETVPRYEGLRPLGKRLADPSSDVFAVLAEFPITTKSDVLRAPQAYLSSRPGARRPVKTVTSGTTGTPFATWMDAGTFNATDALWWRRNAWSGYRHGQWIARLVGDPVVPLADAHPRRPWRVSWVDRRLYLSTFHLSKETAPAFLDVLERRRPDYLMGYPSALEILSRFCLESGRTLAWHPRAVWFSSEPMFEHQRDAIERAFGAPIVGLFGSAERLVSASQCEAGSYHLALVDGFIEGEFGRLEQRAPSLITTLMNRVMPLIRFELGDVIELLPDAACACGRTLPLMAPVVTKLDDWVETPSGRRVSPSSLTWALKDLGGVRRTQIVQVDERTVEVHIDADEPAATAAAKTLEERLRAMLFGEMTVRCVRDTEIPVLESGKTKFVVRRDRRS
jgi:phenylacetate-CoA ligase